MSADEPTSWLKPRGTYEQRRARERREWFDAHRRELPARACAMLEELFAHEQRLIVLVNELIVENGDLRAELNPRANPDALHDSDQRGERIELVPGRRFNRWRNRWEGE